ncbi:MAG TPA: PEP-CTERM sorting domain-containing protein [Verrucomicrobiota bacterium]|nr:PEP-CTERM sorting domain-containing protein [Verrucomicrobiota bacterium]HRZ37285.1 PEP-CTERM sorting domain-containing protein [Candidatus Paceibacterota bacterium]
MNTTRTILRLSVVVAMACVAQAQDFNENFDGYAAGGNVHGQGGWKGWFNDAGAGAVVSTSQAKSAPNSVNITGGSDLVHEFNYTSGKWQISIDQYVPSSASSTADNKFYLIFLNTYNDANQGLNWSIQTIGDLSTGLFSEAGGTGNAAHSATAPIVKDAWATWTLDVDLDANSVQQYYNGAAFGTPFAWQVGGANAIGAIDLYANNTGPVYYDNLTIQQIPEPSVLALIGLGGLALGLRRRVR